jgi:DHA1 family inner membrane transport protein
MTTAHQNEIRNPEAVPLRNLLVLALAVAATVTTELIPAGLLPEISRSLHASPADVGLLVTAWAATIILLSVPLTRLTNRFDRRSVLFVALLAFSISIVGTALAPNFAVALVSRVTGAAAHGLFWSIVIAYAATMTPPQKVGRAVSIVAGGASVATVAGVPLGTALGQLAGWRTTFAVLAVAMLVVAFVIRLALPRAANLAQPAPVRARVQRDRTLLPVIVMSTIACLVTFAHLTVYTYISPLLTEEFGSKGAPVSVMLLVFGIAGLIGLILSGLTSDRWPVMSLLLPLIVMSLGLLALTLSRHQPAFIVIAISAWGLSMGMLPAIIQAAVQRIASDRLKPLASALVLVFFNIGIGLGALVGGQFDESHDLIGALYAAGAFAAIGAVLTPVFFLVARRSAVAHTMLSSLEAA